MVPQTACAGNRRNVAGTAIIRLGLKKWGKSALRLELMLRVESGKLPPVIPFQGRGRSHEQEKQRDCVSNRV